ncbi:Uncharacterised protein [Staphylococcus microti]|uniref:Uncharacterized protein n=1 Tax=Staphylococcus microti TaxID=569857 RepID=A0A380GSI4_9STAP|nr:hypothetical protein [Staphylococcus microti]PNZ84022.1 hypothetical protein CD132_01240 [Staphylococcus microti]SUM56507.1 Uncharacterised protein [Staphylococcus microti]
MPSYITIPIIIVILALQYFMASRQSAIWGAVIPVLYVFVMGYLYVTHHFPSFLSFILFFALGAVFLIEEWHRGRKSIK